jgi:hypothetical protein
MTLLNIIDRRNKPYLWKEITAIFEPTCYDNFIKNSDITENNNYEGVGYDEIHNCSLMSAINFAMNHKNFVTLYIYDLGEGIKCDD